MPKQKKYSEYEDEQLDAKYLLDDFTKGVKEDIKKAKEQRKRTKEAEEKFNKLSKAEQEKANKELEEMLKRLDNIKSEVKEKPKKKSSKKDSLEDGKYEVVKGVATATKKGKAYNIKAKSGINKDLPQEVINEGSKLLRDDIDDHIKIKFIEKGKKYRWI